MQIKNNLNILNFEINSKTWQKINFKNVNILKVRFCFYCSILLLCVSLAFYLLRIDFLKSDNPAIQIYEHGKWKLITTWFNLLHIVYLVISIYCDWCELKGDNKSNHVTLLNKFRNACFSNILFPTTLFADLLFWRLYHKDREMIVPAAVDELVPFWTQHFMHTVSLGITLVDFLLIPRRRPANMKPGVIALSAFVGSYCVVCFHSVYNGVYVYPFLRSYTLIDQAVFILFIFTEHFCFYTGQWIIADLIWLKPVKNIID